MTAETSDTIRSHAAFVWSVADLLRGDYSAAHVIRKVFLIQGAATWFVSLPLQLSAVLGPTLQRGSSGAGVETLQRALAQLGYLSGAIDGRARSRLSSMLRSWVNPVPLVTLGATEVLAGGAG